MNEQTVFNVLIGIVCSGMGWYMKTIFDSVKDLQHTDKELAEKVGQIEILVAGHYCKKDDLEKMSHAIFAKLDRIEDKIDKKADK
jgi:hypothetical protein